MVPVKRGSTTYLRCPRCGYEEKVTKKDRKSFIEKSVVNEDMPEGNLRVGSTRIWRPQHDTSIPPNLLTTLIIRLTLMQLAFNYFTQVFKAK